MTFLHMLNDIGVGLLIGGLVYAFIIWCALVWEKINDRSA